MLKQMSGKGGGKLTSSAPNDYKPNLHVVKVDAPRFFSKPPMNDGRPDNVSLIGMPGSGKSTVGRPLAARLGYRFVDTDEVMETGEGMRLSEIMAAHSPAGFLEIEENYLLSLSGPHDVFSTGGSVVYLDRGMAHLKSLGPVIYLDVPLDVLNQRLSDLEARGVVIAPGKSVADLEAERRPLYEKWADLTIQCGDHPPGWVAAEIVGLLDGRI
ncbi:shikimate kinase [Stratiformator vulcanicus]|uniref:Shikimate kinase n=1 Tax=Stratiformator vulcanicus TaxID=2527980 RepID=A0A517R558_9PLAN|nr:shikimate kinase [Stratiformator vulcanicus]QDT39026.1 Shikimate kinase [Stratiformator vulcanicus]